MQEKQVINNNPIGIFDSGLGGLTVMSSISKLMSKENIIYFGVFLMAQNLKKL